MFSSGTSFCSRYPPQQVHNPSSEAEKAVSSLMWVPTAKHKLIPALIFLFFSPCAIKNQSKDSPLPYSSWERKYIPLGYGSKSRKRRYLIYVSGSPALGAGDISPRYFQLLPQVACYSLHSSETQGPAVSWATLY